MTVRGGGQMAERLGIRAINQKVAGSIPDGRHQSCPWARHFTLLARGGCPCTVSHSG